MSDLDALLCTVIAERTCQQLMQFDVFRRDGLTASEAAAALHATDAMAAMFERTIAQILRAHAEPIPHRDTLAAIRTCGTAPAATEAAATESPSGPSPQGVKP